LKQIPTPQNGQNCNFSGTLPIRPLKSKNAPALKPGHLVLNTAYHQRICSGSASLLIFWFLLILVLRVAVLGWILLGNVLWVALALLSLGRVGLRIRGLDRSGRVLLTLLLFRLLWVCF